MLNLKCVLIGFIAVSGLNVNCAKLEMVRLGSKRDSDGLASY